MADQSEKAADDSLFTPEEWERGVEFINTLTAQADQKLLVWDARLAEAERAIDRWKTQRNALGSILARINFFPDAE